MNPPIAALSAVGAPGNEASKSGKSTFVHNNEPASAQTAPNSATRAPVPIRAPTGRPGPGRENSAIITAASMPVAIGMNMELTVSAEAITCHVKMAPPSTMPKDAASFRFIFSP